MVQNVLECDIVIYYVFKGVIFLNFEVNLVVLDVKVEVCVKDLDWDHEFDWVRFYDVIFNVDVFEVR